MFLPPEANIAQRWAPANQNVLKTNYRQSNSSMMNRCCKHRFYSWNRYSAFQSMKHASLEKKISYLFGADSWSKMTVRTSARLVITVKLGPWLKVTTTSRFNRVGISFIFYLSFSNTMLAYEPIFRSPFKQKVIWIEWARFGSCSVKDAIVFKNAKVLIFLILSTSLKTV